MITGKDIKALMIKIAFKIAIDILEEAMKFVVDAIKREVKKYERMDF